MKVYGELVRAQLEILQADPSAGIEGRIWFNDVTNLVKFDTDGSVIAQVLDSVHTLSMKTNLAVTINGTAADSVLTISTAGVVSIGINTGAMTISAAGAVAFAGGTAVTGVEHGYLSGVTSAIQTQLNNVNVTTKDPNLVGNIAISSAVNTSGALIVSMVDQSGAALSSANTGTINFRSTTLTSGVFVTRTTTSAGSSMTLPLGATLGQIDGVAAKIYVYALDNAGAIEIAVAGESFIDADSKVSTTTVDTNSDSALVMYSTTGRSNVACKLLGVITNTQTSAGNWASAGTVVESVGVNPIASVANLSANSRTRATGTTVRAGGVAISASCASVSTSSGTYADITNLAVTITTTGRPVYIGFIGDGTTGSSGSSWEINGIPNSVANQLFGFVKILQDSTAVLETSIYLDDQQNAVAESLRLPCSMISFVDTPAAGTYVYKAQFKCVSSNITSPLFFANLMKMIAYEL